MNHKLRSRWYFGDVVKMVWYGMNEMLVAHRVAATRDLFSFFFF